MNKTTAILNDLADAFQSVEINLEMASLEELTEEERIFAIRRTEPARKRMLKLFSEIQNEFEDIVS